MKSIKDRISDNQDFYNGVTLGVALGAVVVLTLVSNGVVGRAVNTRQQDALSFGFAK